MEDKLKGEIDRLIKVNDKLEKCNNIDIATRGIKENALTICEIVKTLKTLKQI